MDWKGGRRSNNIDDLRNSPGAAGGIGLIGLAFRFIPFLIRTSVVSVDFIDLRPCLGRREIIGNRSVTSQYAN